MLSFLFSSIIFPIRWIAVGCSEARVWGCIHGKNHMLQKNMNQIATWLPDTENGLSGRVYASLAACVSVWVLPVWHTHHRGHTWAELELSKGTSGREWVLTVKQYEEMARTEKRWECLIGLGQRLVDAFLFKELPLPSAPRRSRYPSTSVSGAAQCEE